LVDDNKKAQDKFMNKAFKITTKEQLNDQIGELTQLLSRAFFNDPYYSYIMPNDEKRLAQIKWWQNILLRYTFRNGSIYVTKDNKGVAMWLGPNRPIINEVEIAILGLMLYPFKIGFNNFLRMLKVSTQWTEAHKKQNKKHYYLMVIGVDPNLQKNGLGTQLMADVLVNADKEKLDCFLETVTLENVKFYQKFNFEIILNKEFGNDSQYWLMKRKPRG
jgi:ribosomal protein S18 acetylase RimI-like enzyme